MKETTMCYSGLLFIAFLRLAVNIEPPRQLRLSLGNTDDVMTVMWATADDVNGHVEYGESRNNLNSEAKSTKARLQRNSWNALRNIHRAQIIRLLPGKTYYYKVVLSSNGKKSESNITSFRTINQYSEAPRHFLVYGDLGSYFGKPTYPVLKEEIDTGQYDVVWHIGDIAYNLNTNGGKYGDDFFDQIEPVASRVPYMTLPGNHEYADDFHHYRVRFSMPGTTWPMELHRLWFSYNIGLVHFISFSTEVYFLNNQNYVCTQYDWLLQDLTEANKNRDKQPWIVAMGHRPMYCSNDEPISDCTPGFFHYWVRNGLEDLFHYMGVDLLVMGHEHSYERFWPMYRQKVFAQNYMDPEGTVHVISGAAGCNQLFDKMGTPVPGSAFRVDSKSYHSYGKLTVYNNTHLQFIQKTVEPRGELDNFIIVQHHHGPRIKDLNCEKGMFAICRCPFPFHFVTAAVASGIGLLLMIVLITFCCCRNCKCCPFSKRKRCCRKTWTRRLKPRDSDVEQDLDRMEPDTYNLLDHIDPEV